MLNGLVVETASLMLKGMSGLELYTLIDLDPEGE
jgi:hypothetical protein